MIDGCDPCCPHALCDRDDRGVCGAEREVGVGANEVGHPGEIGGGRGFEVEFTGRPKMMLSGQKS